MSLSVFEIGGDVNYFFPFFPFFSFRKGYVTQAKTQQKAMTANSIRKMRRVISVSGFLFSSNAATLATCDDSAFKFFCDICADCNHVPNGSAYNDACGMCVGGDTDSTDALFIYIDTLITTIPSGIQNYPK